MKITSFRPKSILAYEEASQMLMKMITSMFEFFGNFNLFCVV